MFLWQRVDSCTDRYHEEGGVVVFATSENLAKRLANKYIDKHFRNWVGEPVAKGIQPDEKPDLVVEVVDDDSELFGKVFVFPDAGCC